MNDPEKSDPRIVATKPTNKAGRPGAELVEPRLGTKGNAGRQSTHRSQTRERVTQALDRVRHAARQRKKERFTALLHHVNVDALRMAFHALKRDAAPGVDGMTWADYEADLEPRLAALHGRVQRGAYRPQPSRRTGRRRRMADSGHWRLPPWRTRLPGRDRHGAERDPRGRLPRVLVMGFGRDVASMMRWTRWRSGSPAPR